MKEQNLAKRAIEILKIVSEFVISEVERGHHLFMEFAPHVNSVSIYTFGIKYGENNKMLMRDTFYACTDDDTEIHKRLKKFNAIDLARSIAMSEAEYDTFLEGYQQ